MFNHTTQAFLDQPQNIYTRNGTASLRPMQVEQVPHIDFFPLTTIGSNGHLGLPDLIFTFTIKYLPMGIWDFMDHEYMDCVPYVHVLVIG